MHKYFLPYFTAVFFCILLINVQGQSYQFSKYGIESGLPQQYVYSINQDNNGFIWVGTGEGISKFDGIEFETYTVEDGLSENFITCSSQRQKNIIWLGHNKGGVSRIKDGIIENILSDTLLDSKITSISVDQDNYVWAVSQNGSLLRINPKLEVKKFILFEEEKKLNCIYAKIETNLLIGTDEGLYLFNLNNKLEPSESQEIKSFHLKNIQSITKSKSSDNTFWIGTAESGLHQLEFNGKSKYRSRQFNDEKLNNTSIQNIEEDENKNLWVSTFSGLLKVVYDKTKGLNNIIEYNASNGLSDFIKSSYIDREGNVWISSYGEGLAMLKDEIFVFYSHETTDVPNNTRSFLFQDSVKWFGLSEGLLRVTPFEEVKWKYYSNENGFTNSAVTSIVAFGYELFIGTEGKGLYRYNTKTEKFKKEYLITSYLSNSIHKLIISNNELWIATEGGLIRKNLITEDTEVFNTLRGLKHNSIYDIIELKDGGIALGSHSNEVTIIKENQLKHFTIADIDQPMDIVGLNVDQDNNLWLASLGNGIFKQQNDSFIQITSKDGLKSDYCYSLISDNLNGLWVGHRGSLSRISTTTFQSEIFDKKKGINDDFNKGAVYKDKENNIWFGTNRRTIKFNPKKFLKNSTPPIVSVKNIFISDNKTKLSKTIELPYGAYKLKIEFIGISFKQPEGVKYQYFLEGYDLNWSESSTVNFANYPRIDDGEYKFYVKACNTDGFCSDETYAFDILIAKPFWKKWWFYLISLIVLVSIIYAIIKKREKNQKEIQRKLEIELDKRTKEVTNKNKELETKNKNITDSINYALRIQKSILPSTNLLTEIFPESFIYYQPRDIVSGDFYWYEKIDDKLIVACADCTGHGVPGAFMSMISSTLLKEIAHQNKITDPAEFLFKLDSLLMKTLKKTGETSINDGLDLSLCVFDLKTNHLTFSGAFRPILLYKNNELERLKTFPYSIGGGDFIIKEFQSIEIQLEVGDIVYLFTDGYPDQFGGEKGKKLYLKGFENLVKNSLHLGMKEQSIIFKDFFNEWKAERNQIDDVLVMGIKIT